MQPPRMVPMGIRNEEVEVGAHVAYFWENDAEFNEGVQFLQTGINAGDFCVIFGHDEANARVCARLKEVGTDCAVLQRENRLAILSGHSDADAMLGTIGETFSKAVQGGAKLIRLLGNIGWGRDAWPSERDILEFEGKVTAAAQRFPCVIVCMYDVRALPGRVIVHGAFETHPLTICGNMLRENPYYVEFDEFLRRLDRDPVA
jgi:hypothetical protein